MPDKHLPYDSQPQLVVAAMQPNGLACRNSTGDYVGLAVDRG